MKIGLNDPKPDHGMRSGEKTGRLREEGINGGIVKGGGDLTGLERRGGH